MISPSLRTTGKVALWVCIAAIGLLVALIVLVMGGVMLPTAHRDLTDRKPFADFIGREYRVISEVNAYAWNDFPDKEKILQVSLATPPYYGNRFVSWVLPLQRGQKIRIVGASSYLTLEGWARSYLVQVPGVRLPEGVPVQIGIDSDGLLDPRVYEPVGE